MERTIEYTEAMTKVKWDNPKEYTSISHYILGLRKQIEDKENLISTLNNNLCYFQNVVTAVREYLDEDGAINADKIYDALDALDNKQK